MGLLKLLETTPFERVLFLQLQVKEQARVILVQAQNLSNLKEQLQKAEDELSPSLIKIRLLEEVISEGGISRTKRRELENLVYSLRGRLKKMTENRDQLLNKQLRE